LSFKAALEQDPPILSDYKIVSTIVTTSEIQRMMDDNDFVRSDGKDWSVEGDASTFAAMIALRKLVNERGIKHAVSFHSSIKRSREFGRLNAEASKADNSFVDLSSFHVSGKDSTGVRSATLERFVDAEPSLVTNARCLTEGVDVPAIDAVLFADPEGHALSKPCNEEWQMPDARRQVYRGTEGQSERPEAWLVYGAVQRTAPLHQ